MYIAHPIYKKTKRYSYAVDNIYNTRCYNQNSYKLKFISCHKLYKDEYVNDVYNGEIYDNDYQIKDRNEIIRIEEQEKKIIENNQNNNLSNNDTN